MDLIRAMEAKGITGVHRSHLSAALNGNMFPIMARKIEIGLDLPENSLVRMVPSVKKARKIQESNLGKITKV